jgi:hypothetical protein
MPHHRPSARILSLLLVAVALGGLLLQSLLGNQFLGDYSYRPAVIAPVLAVLALAVLVGIETRTSAFRRRVPTTWVRWLAWPLFTFTLAGVLFLSGRGWLVGLSRLLANKQATVELTVVSASRRETRRTLCRQYLQLEYGASMQYLCADQLLAEGHASVGETILASGAASPLGLHVTTLRLR